MARFIGEFECKVDGKGRILVPARLKKQLPPEAQDGLIINRSFDQCLVLFTRADWEAETAKLSGLNLFNKKDRQFFRLFNNGAQELSFDPNDRILIPKRLLEYASISNEVVLFAYGNRIELWSKEIYEREMSLDPEEFSSLAEEVMGKNNPHQPQSPQ